MTATPTPRTDAEAFIIPAGDDRKQYQGGEYVRAVVSRTLERELATARADGLREAAELCMETWRSAPNTRPEYKQNRIAHGCMECNRAILALLPRPAEKGDER